MKLLKDFEGVITSAITAIASHPVATVDNLKYFYVGVVVSAAVQKLIPACITGIYVKLWPQLPRWCWAPIGIWMLVMTYLGYIGRYDIALPMIWTFYGGVWSSITIVNIKTLHIGLFCGFHELCTAALSTKISTRAVFPDFFHFHAIGYAIGAGLLMLGPKKVAKSKSK